ncbi:MAG: hypothetical protein D6690_03305 [Nitrospirae bacterium]|nr:MAG: hypothetical protein D6690_03305 [Nitrospirota bacterium]
MFLLENFDTVRTAMTDISHIPDSDPPGKPYSARLVRWLASLGLASLLVIGMLALALTYWFPSELVRTALEEQLSAGLDGHVTIAALSFNALTGLELNHITFRRRDRQLLSLQRLNLDYSVLGLLRGTLLINEVLIDQATVNLNLLEFAPPAPAPPRSTTPTSESPALPVLPMAVDLQAFVINDTDIRLRVSPTLALVLTDVDLDLSGAIGIERAQLTGLLNIAHAEIDIDRRHLELPVQLAFSLVADLPGQVVEIERLTIESLPALRASLSGRIEDMLTTPHIDLSLNEMEIDVQPLLTMAESFLPAEMDTALGGHLLLVMDIDGVQTDSGFQGVVDLEVRTTDFRATLPAVQAEIQTTDLAVRLDKINIRNNVLQFGNVAVTTSDTNLRYQDIIVADARVSATSEYFTAGPFSGAVKTSGVMTTPARHPLPSLTLPFSIHLNASGNHKTQEFSIKTLAVELGNLLSLESQGAIHPAPSAQDGLQISLTTRMEPQLAAIFAQLPSFIPDGVMIQKTEDAPDIIAIDLSGIVDPTYRPKVATITVGVKLANITGAMDDLPAGGTLDRLNVLVAADYRGQDGHFTGTVGSRLTVSNVYEGYRLTVGQTALALKSQFDGAVNEAFTPTALRTHDHLTIEFRDLVYDEPSLKAQLARMTVRSETVQDLFDREYRIKTLHIRSDPLIDLAAQGFYRMTDQRFDVGITVSKLDLREVFRHMSGGAVEPILVSKPQGTIYATLSASGHVPESWDVVQGVLPLRLESLLTLRHISGAIADHSVNDLHGSVALTFQPGTHPTATVATDLQAATIRLANIAPADMSKVFAKIKMLVHDFDELHIDTAQLGITGASVAAQGTVSGIKAFLAGATSMATSLEQLFARLSTRVSFDLASAQTLLAGLGMEGTGTAQIDLAVLKKGRGPLDVKLDVGAQDLDIRYHDIAIADLDGTLSLHKHFTWKGQSARTPNRRVIPSDLLSQLHALGGQGKRLTIRHIDLGRLTLSNLSTTILFDQTDFKIQNLTMNLLGGGFGGTILMTMGPSPAVSAHLEAVHLDLNELLIDRQQIPGDSRIDATVRLALTFDEETGTIDLHRSIVDVYLTHIGREALDRFLVVLDPKGSNPALVAARAQVRLANPSQVTLRLSRGLLDLKIVFGEGLLSSFTMNRIPAGSLAEMLNIAHVPQWDRIVAIATLIGASTYDVDAQGHLRFE